MSYDCDHETTIVKHRKSDKASYYVFCLDCKHIIKECPEPKNKLAQILKENWQTQALNYEVDLNFKMLAKAALNAVCEVIDKTDGTWKSSREYIKEKLREELL